MSWSAALVFNITTSINIFNILHYHKIRFMTIFFTYEHQKTVLGFFSINFSNFDKTENNESSGLKAPNDFDILAP